MQKQIIILFLCLNLFPLFGQKQIWSETAEQKTQRLAWWTNDRFGMFIHFGLYSLPARHEWVQTKEKIGNGDYRKYFDNFNPDLFNPKDWAKKAKEAGMKYAVLTAKHHEGFSLFDSKFTDFKATNPAINKDLVKEFVEAFRAEGINVGLYYSLIDWHHPDFTIDSKHSLRPADTTQYAKLNNGRNMNRYREFLFNQVQELLTNYGKIDILWLDFSYPEKYGKSNKDWDSPRLVSLARKLQPGIIIDDRADLKEYQGGWDFVTPEQFKVKKWPEIDGQKVPWETCQTFSGSWGYFRDELTWKSTAQLLELLIESVSKGGNVILNVGPTARGVFDYRADKILSEIGSWMKFNGRSIYGCTQAPANFKTPANSLLTFNPKTNRLYIHLLSYPLQNFTLEGFKDKFKYAQFLHDGSEVQVAEGAGDWLKEKVKEGDVNFILPVNKPNVEIPVIELTLK